MGKIKESKTKRQIDKFINDFKNCFKCNFPNLQVSYVYHKEEDLYGIWYDDEELENEDNFESICGEMIESYFDKYDIYNVFIDYKERA